MIGSIRNEVGAWFDAVFYMEVDKLPTGERQFKMLTVGGRRHKAKIRVPSSIASKILASEEQSFTKLQEKIDKEWAEYVRSRDVGNKPVQALPAVVQQLVQPGGSGK